MVNGLLALALDAIDMGKKAVGLAGKEFSRRTPLARAAASYVRSMASRLR